MIKEIKAYEANCDKCGIDIELMHDKDADVRRCVAERMREEKAL